MIVLVVQYTVQPGTEAQAVAFIRHMQQHTRREPGCRLYVGHQSLEDPRRLLFYEQYVDQAAMDEHRAAPYFAEYVTNGLAKIAESRKAQLFTAIED